MNNISVQKSATYKFNYIRHDGVNLALHSWIPQKPNAVLFLFHGMQSHAGWFAEVGTYLADHAIATFILDRRGVGMSGGLRGDIPNVDSLLEDYLIALTKVKSLYPKLPLTLLGQSLGGSILAALLSWRKFAIAYDAVVFCAAGLGLRHNQLSASEYQALLKDRTIELSCINLSGDDMTDDSFYLDFIRKDSLCYKQMRHRARAVLLEIEDMYWQKRGVIDATKSALFVYPQYDPIVNTEMALKIFMQLSDNKGMLLQLPSIKHFLWFTDQRRRLLQWLSHYILTGGYGR